MKIWRKKSFNQIFSSKSLLLKSTFCLKAFIIFVHKKLFKQFDEIMWLKLNFLMRWKLHDEIFKLMKLFENSSIWNFWIKRFTALFI